MCLLVVKENWALHMGRNVVIDRRRKKGCIPHDSNPHFLDYEAYALLLCYNRGQINTNLLQNSVRLAEDAHEIRLGVLDWWKKTLVFV